MFTHYTQLIHKLFPWWYPQPVQSVHGSWLAWNRVDFGWSGTFYLWLSIYSLRYQASCRWGRQRISGHGPPSRCSLLKVACWCSNIQDHSQKSTCRKELRCFCHRLRLLSKSFLLYFLTVCIVTNLEKVVRPVRLYWKPHTRCSW